MASSCGKSTETLSDVLVGWWLPPVILTPASGGACLQFGSWISPAAKRGGERGREGRRRRRVGKREAESSPWERHGAELTLDDLYPRVSTQINGD